MNVEFREKTTNLEKKQQINEKISPLKGIDNF